MAIRPEDITFGVELEYIWSARYTSPLLASQNAGPHHWPQTFLQLSDNMFQDLAAQLSTLPGIECQEAEKGTGYTHWKLEPDSSLDLGEAADDEHRRSILALIPPPSPALFMFVPASDNSRNGVYPTPTAWFLPGGTSPRKSLPSRPQVRLVPAFVSKDRN